jgi:DsbC/DsbD-like thiol-disulfide interchange protein
MFFRARDFSASLTIAGLLTFQAPVAHALESPWADTGKAAVRLLAAGSSSAGSATLRAGIEVRLAPGWYTYWRYPGDAGVPPRFDWSGSANIASVEVRWPAPERIPVEAGLQSIGYRRDVIFPLSIRAANPALPTTLRLKLDFGVCQKICIPATAGISLEIPPGNSVALPALDAAEARVPVSVSLGKREAPAVVAARLDRAKELRALIDVTVPPGRPFDLFAEGPTEEWALPLPSKIESNAGRARFSVMLDGAPAGSGPIPSKLRLTLTADDRAVEVLVPLD